MKYPVDIQSFEQIINEGYVYVDKTDLIYSLVSDGKIYTMCRPHKFGKSLLISTLENYFLGKKDLFNGLAIEKLETEWKTYPVFHIDLNGVNFQIAGAFEKKISDYLTEWENKYNVDVWSNAGIGFRFENVLEAAHKQTGLGCVVLIDDYDKPVLDVLGSNITTEIDGREISLEEENCNTMMAFYSTLKSADADLHFVLLTGVMKVVNMSPFSGFNSADDISTYQEYDALCGISEEEIDQYFREPIEEIAKKKGITSADVKSLLKKQYGGYHFSRKMGEIYNPFSLLNAFEKKEIDNYWVAAGTPACLVNLLDRDNVDINEYLGKYYSTSDFTIYNMTYNALLPMLYQSGYLTIKEYDRDFESYVLDIPNDEVKNGFISLLHR